LQKKGTRVARYLSCVLALLLFSSFSAAQSSDHVKIFGGYSHMNPEFTSTASGGVSGWNVSATFKVVRYVGIVADFSGFSPSSAGASASYQTIMGGPQVSMRIGRIEPFAHFLIGVTHGTLTHRDEPSGSDFNSFTYGGGGGVDFGLNRWLAVRGQVDGLHIGSNFANGQGSSVARVSTGLVFRF
jgi:Outer membrane protein beta-barrel domain